MGAEGVLDFAGLDATAAAADSGSAQVETPTVDANVSTQNTDVQGGEQGEVINQVEADGAQPEVDDDLPGTESTPQEIRQALKAVKAANPQNTKIINQLHNAYERAQAYSQQFESVQAAEEAKAFLESMGGIEGYEQQQQILQAVNAQDELLYNGDGQLIKDIVEDLRSEGKLDALGKLAPQFLDSLQQVDKESFFKVMNPHVVNYLEGANFLPAVNAILGALGSTEVNEDGTLKNPPNVAEIRAIAQSMAKWFNGEKSMAEKSKAPVGPNPEIEKLNAQKTQLQKEREEWEQGKKTEFQKGVATENATVSNRLLGKELSPFLKTPYFKAFKVANLRPLANTIQTNLHTELENDKGYQAQMKALWGQKTPDKQKIQELHRVKVESIARRIVKDTVAAMYPDHTKGGSAAGRIAAAAQKKDQQKVVEQEAQATGKPIYVAQKPGRDEIDWSKDPKTYLFIAGRAYLKNGRYVTWRKS